MFRFFRPVGHIPNLYTFHVTVAFLSNSHSFRCQGSEGKGDNSDDEEENALPERQASGSETIPKRTVKRKLSVSEDDKDSDAVIIDEEDARPFYVSSAKGRGKGKAKLDPMVNIMEDRTIMMKDFTKSFSTMVANKRGGNEAAQNQDRVVYWAQSLANRVREFDPRRKR